MVSILQQRIRDDLREDLLTAWAPDVAADAELDEYLLEAWVPPRLGQRVALPRPGRRPDSDVLLLHPAWHIELHEATQPLRESADRLLAPGVRGYRRGAHAGSAYSDDFRALRGLFDEHVTYAAFVVFADVERFFPTLKAETIKKAVLRTVSSTDAERLCAFVDRTAAFGIAPLPAGYADARLVANIVLDQADKAIDVPFTRWVDDYRLFVPKGVEPTEVVRSLDEALSALGLRLNSAKTKVLSLNEAEKLAGDSLGSVYHPDRDPPDQVRDNLHRLFYAAAKDPVAERRGLRFVLPRLALEQDDVAVRFALETLFELPWEAPRFVAYLGSFLEHPDVRPGVDSAIRSAAQRRNWWLVSRLASLACRLPLSRRTLDVLRESLGDAKCSPAWGLTLRILSVHERTEDVLRALDDPIPDSRAAVVALRDLELPLSDALTGAEPVLAEWLEHAMPILPAIDSIL